MRSPASSAATPCSAALLATAHPSGKLPRTPRHHSHRPIDGFVEQKATSICKGYAFLSEEPEASTSRTLPQSAELGGNDVVCERQGLQTVDPERPSSVWIRKSGNVVWADPVAIHVLSVPSWTADANGHALGSTLSGYELQDSLRDDASNEVPRSTVSCHSAYRSVVRRTLSRSTAGFAVATPAH
jgi:hypothetical protein